MLASSLGLSLPHGHVLLIAVIGMTSAGLTLLLGFILASRRRRPALPQTKQHESRPDPFVFGSAMEKRTALRRRGNPTKVVLADNEGGGDLGEAWVLDRSTGGLCLQVDHQAIPVGTILKVRPGNVPPEVPWTQVEVKSCRPEGSSWELGCRFLKTPSWSVLLLFG